MTELRGEPLRESDLRRTEHREQLSRGFFQAGGEDGVLLECDAAWPDIASRPLVEEFVGLRDVPAAVARTAVAADEALLGQTFEEAGKQRTADAGYRGQV